MMVIDMDVCECGERVSYEKVRCSNNHFVGTPNVRVAKSMRSSLQGHFSQAEAAALEGGLVEELSRLILKLDGSVATISLSEAATLNILNGDVYKNYWATLNDKQRAVAMRQHHADRDKVDSAVHTAYKEGIIDAALSPDGYGLPSYGAVCITIKAKSIEKVSSLLRDNAYRFYTDYGLGALSAIEPPGWRATWDDRGLLGVAKLARGLTPGCSDEEIGSLILTSANDRSGDAFIEVHIYRHELTANDIETVRVNRGQTVGGDDWRKIKELLRHYRSGNRRT